jgi:hypothetical protein
MPFFSIWGMGSIALSIPRDMLLTGKKYQLLKEENANDKKDYHSIGNGRVGLCRL